MRENLYNGSWLMAHGVFCIFNLTLFYEIHTYKYSFLLADKNFDIIFSLVSSILSYSCIFFLTIFLCKYTLNKDSKSLCVGFINNIYSLKELLYFHVEKFNKIRSTEI